MSRDWIRDQQWKLTPLVRASISGNLEIMQLLIEAGADVNGVDEWGDTPLMATVEFRHIEAAILLLENGADIDATKPNGTTALMIAARNEDLMSTDLLLRKGADPKIGLGSGDTALSLAAWNGNKEIVRLLIEYGAIPDNLAFARVQGYDKNIICILLENAALENAEIVEETEHTILNIGATTQVAGSNRVRSAILAEQTNKNICRLALTPTGDWEIIFPFNNYAAEARRRGYTADQCAALTGIATTQIAQAEMKRQAESNIHAAESGDVVAQHNLGVRYENGEGLRRDYTEALKWYRKAAESGYAPSQNNLGNMYAEGIGVEKDNQEARKWYLKAAEQGLARAQYNLGIRSLKVESVARYSAEAIRWFARAAYQGFASAQYMLGHIYREGLCSTQDYGVALRWYKQAAEEGYYKGQALLGAMYFDGQGVPRNYDIAFKWFTLAAEQGDADAYYYRGKIYVEWSEYDHAISDINKAVTINPNHVRALNSLAWIQATAKNRKYRNGKEAISNARRAVFLTNRKDAMILETLAAAYAEDGQFKKAEETMHEAILNLSSTDKSQFGGIFEATIKSYQRERKYY
jgi:TPR repeat protein